MPLLPGTEEIQRSEERPPPYAVPSATAVTRSVLKRALLRQADRLPARPGLSGPPALAIQAGWGVEGRGL